MIKSKIENFSTETIIETVMGECESIISVVEDFIFENESIDLTDFEQIRYCAEEMQTLVLQLEDSTTKEEKLNTLEELEELSVTLYQFIKYEVDNLVELELFDYDMQEFKYLRSSIYVIRTLFV